MLLYGSHDAPPTVVIQEPSATSLIVRCSLSNGHPTDGGSIAGLCLDGRFCEQLYMLLYRGSASPPLPLSTSPASNGMLDSVQLYIWVLSLSAAAPAMADGVSILCWPKAALYTVLPSLRTIRQTEWRASLLPRSYAAIHVALHSLRSSSQTGWTACPESGNASMPNAVQAYPWFSNLSTTARM